MKHSVVVGVTVTTTLESGIDWSLITILSQKVTLM